MELRRSTAEDLMEGKVLATLFASPTRTLQHERSPCFASAVPCSRVEPHLAAEGESLGLHSVQCLRDIIILTRTRSSPALPGTRVPVTADGATSPIPRRACWTLHTIYRALGRFENVRSPPRTLPRAASTRLGPGHYGGPELGGRRRSVSPIPHS